MWTGVDEELKGMSSGKSSLKIETLTEGGERGMDGKWVVMVFKNASPIYILKPVHSKDLIVSQWLLMLDGLMFLDCDLSLN